MGVILVGDKKGAIIRVFEVGTGSFVGKYNYPNVSPPWASVGLFLDMYSRVVFLYKANYKSSPIPMLFFLVAPCNILRPLAAFWT